MQLLRRVVNEVIEFLIYEGLPKLSKFLVEFEEKVSEPQRLLALEEELKATPARWWETHKK